MSSAVIDVGKTHARLSILDDSGAVLAQQRRTNAVLATGLYPHFDVDALFGWMGQALRDALDRWPVRRLICTTHGACGALLHGERLALPVMDYEWTGPAAASMQVALARYESQRDPFAATLSPSLPAGLNLARQLCWQSLLAPAQFAASDGFLPYPQYWAWRFCGERAAEVSSLGSHTDLWRPIEARASMLAQALGIDRRLPPLRHAGEVLGRIDVRRAGLPATLASIDVHCGVHDSSAAYVANFPDPAAPGVVVSTGTWIVCMAPLRAAGRLDPRRDTSGTVSVHGTPLACSRFMGGREFAALAGAEGLAATATPADLAAVLRAGTLALPPHAPSGPFQHAAPNGSVRGAEPSSAAARAALAALYCALVTDICLELIEARGSVTIDGPFARNELYLGALAALRWPDPVIPSLVADGPTLGAAMLASGGAIHAPAALAAAAPLLAEEVRAHRDAWRTAVGAAPR
jgi:sugar (pentulose or hexulose) kinase